MSEYNKSQPVISDQLSQTENKSGVIGTSNSPINFAQEVNAVEIVNNSTSAVVYISYSGPATTTTGLPIYPQQYYSCNRRLTSFNIISDSTNTDVRIMGHYEYEAHN